jgi:hypothetical protein
VARPRDELAARVEELLEAGGHRVERIREFRNLSRAADRRPGRQLAGGERVGRRANASQ